MSTELERGWARPVPVSRLAGPVLADLLNALWSVSVTTVALLVGLQFTSLQVTRYPLLIGTTIAASFLLEVVLGSPLRLLASRGGVLWALLLGFGVQLVVIGSAISLAVGRVINAADALVVLFVAAIILALGRWLLGSTDSGYVVGAATSRVTRALRSRSRLDPDATPAQRGLLVVQLDGVSLEVIRRAIAAGQVPNIARWLSSSHTLSPWWSTVPSTTPAFMAGALHGDDTVVPAFRWWDRRAGRLLAASKPSDSALVEDRFDAGQGLLAGGVAVSTVYSGEADDALLVISRATSAKGLGQGSQFISFFTRPFLLPGALVLTVGEIIKEVYQGRQQRVRGVEPRITRKPSYIAARGVSNVLLRRLNLSLVGEQMSQGTPIIFVDFVDYDEIAHHAGPERPEAMRALEGMDGVLGALEQVARAAGTDYELVLVSDHGQSLGATFEQLNGCTLGDRVADLMGAPNKDAVPGNQDSGELFGPINALLGTVLGWGPARPPLLGPDRQLDSSPHLPPVAVTGGGNLGMVWFPQLGQRPTLTQISAHWPNLVPGLLATPGVGLVLASDDQHRPVIVGLHGARVIDPDGDQLTGDDPLAGYPSRAAADLARLHALTDCGDLVLLSTLDRDGTIHAFEGQVGSHGGLGGPQNHGIVIHPRGWTLDAELTEQVPELGVDPVLVGPVSIHRQLTRWRANWVKATE